MNWFIILLLLLLGIILYPVLKVWLAVRRTQQRLRDAYRSAREQYDRGGSPAGGNDTAPRRKAPRGGEYAEYEEVSSGDQPATPEAESSTQQDCHTDDPLVSEAEFEEI